MRYDDINPAFDALQENITTASPYIVGVFAPESTVYISLNGEHRHAVNTDIGGLFEYDLVYLDVGDVVLFYVKNGTDYAVFFEERIRE